MSDLKALLEREERHFELPPGAFDRLADLRDRRRRTKQVVATVLTLLALVVAVTGAIVVFRSSERRVPTEPPPPRSGDLEAVPAGTTFHDLTADVDGNLWWVDPGLTRFEPSSGSQRTFTIADDPRFGDPWPIASARDGGVWMASYGETVRRFDGAAFRDVLDGAPCDIVEAPDGTLFGIECREDRVLRWDGASWVEVPTDGRPDVAAGHLTLDASGAPWVTNRGSQSPSDMGVSRFDGTTWTTWTKGEGLPDDRVYAIDAAPNGDVWVGTPLGVARFTDGVWVTYPPSEVGLTAQSILATDAGVWIAGGEDVDAELAAHFDGSSWAPVTAEDGLDTTGGGIRFARASGNVWAATAAGLFRLDGARWQLVLRSSGPSSWNSVTAVDADEAWITADEDVWSVEEDVWTRDGGHGLPTGVHDLAVAGDGQAWAAAPAGLARFDGARWEVVEAGEHVAVALAPDGTPWTATPDGQDRTSVGPVGGPSLSMPAPLSPFCFRFAVVAPDDVWAASCIPSGWGSAGLAHYDGEGWSRVAPVDGRPELGVLSLVSTPDGDVWASAEYDTVLRFDGSTWTVWTAGDGLPSEIGTIDVGPDGRIFLAADEGLLEFRQDEWRLVQEGSFSDLSVAEDGTIWLVGDGIYRLRAP